MDRPLLCLDPYRMTKEAGYEKTRDKNNLEFKIDNECDLLLPIISIIKYNHYLSSRRDLNSMIPRFDNNMHSLSTAQIPTG